MHRRIPSASLCNDQRDGNILIVKRMGVSGFKSSLHCSLGCWILFVIFCTVWWNLLIVYNLVTPPQSISFFFLCFSFPAVNFPDICRIWMEAGTVLILQVNGAAHSSQQIFFEHLLYVGHLFQVQGRVSSRSFCSRKCRQLQLESILMQLFIYTSRKKRKPAYAREQMFPG